MLRPFAHLVGCCWMLLLVVAQSLKPVKVFSQQLPTFLFFCDRRSEAQRCWIRLHCSSNIVGATHARYAWMHYRSQTCWELLHPSLVPRRSRLGQSWTLPWAVTSPRDAHHCQYVRNNSQHCWRNNVGSCCARLHAALVTTWIYTYPNLGPVQTSCFCRAELNCNLVRL